MSTASTASRATKVRQRVLTQENSSAKLDAGMPGKPIAGSAATALGTSGPVASPLRQTAGMTALAFIAGLAFLAAFILLASLGLALWPKKQK